MEMMLLIKNASESIAQDTQQLQCDQEEEDEGMDDSDTANAAIHLNMSTFFEDQVR